MINWTCDADYTIQILYIWIAVIRHLQGLCYIARRLFEIFYYASFYQIFLNLKNFVLKDEWKIEWSVGVVGCSDLNYLEKMMLND